MKKVLVLGCIVACMVAVAMPIVAQDDKPKTGAGQPAGDDMMKKMMEECAKYAAPGEFHSHLKPLVGKWTCECRFRFMPDAEWTVSKSECNTEWILGDRFITQKHHGDPMPGTDTPFEGFGVIGYDNFQKKYVSIWMDNMSTMIANAAGESDANGKTITFMSRFPDPMQGGKETWMKSTYRIQGNDRYTLEMSGPGPDGKEFTCMTLNYTRMK